MAKKKDANINVAQKYILIKHRLLGKFHDIMRCEPGGKPVIQNVMTCYSAKGWPVIQGDCHSAEWAVYATCSLLPAHMCTAC